MITLKAAEGENPAIEWDETITGLYAQSSEAQQWVAENLFSVAPVDTTETIARSGKADLTRITDQTYDDGTRTLVVTRTYKNNNDCSVASATYTMN